MLIIRIPLLLAPCFASVTDKASAVLHRYRRANTGLIEEMFPGNLERECLEEKCDYEEAREVFENDLETVIADTRDLLRLEPCMNGGKCQDSFHDYACSCPAGYEGKNCEIDVSCSSQNGGCSQICENGLTRKATCSCVNGYRLKEDQKTCEPTVPFPCGRITNPEAVKNMLSRSLETGATSPTDSFQEKLGNVPPPSSLHHLDTNSVKGEVPWQVVQLSWLFPSVGKGFCEGVVVSEKWVLTAAQCLAHEPQTILAGEYNTGVFEHTEQVRRIVRAIPYPAHNASHKHLYDIALLELDSPLIMNSYITPICIMNKSSSNNLLMAEAGTVSGWWRTTTQQRMATVLQLQKVHYAPQNTCLGDTGDTASQHLFCAGPSAPATKTYSEQSGTPYTTNFKGTFFLTGIASCREPCTGTGNYNLYTRVGDYEEWIQNMITLP
uniref:Coagulation factor IX n=1 Tax=Varanus komodoensis TaxID=61221 RepID=A0A8D2IUW6_VARKO